MTPTPRPRIPRTVWILGFVSMLMDISSEMIHTLLPVYLVTGLGASAITVGFIEGFAIATAALTKVFAGVITDRTGKRKLLTVIGYGLGALSKPFFPLAGSVTWIVAARFLDRIGKGVRGAPRDALIADVTPPEMRGASFGLRKSLDTAGGFLGPLIAFGLMLATQDDFITVFWIAVIPAFLAVAMLVVGIQEPATASSAKPAKRLGWQDVARLNGPAWAAIGVASLLALARFSEAFLILRANQAGVPLAALPLVIVAMHLIYGLTAYPVGVLSDRIGRHGLLLCGLGFLIAADVALAMADGMALLAVGVLFWGLHMGFTQGLVGTLVADTAPPHLRGTTFGILNLVTGLAALVGNVVAGLLWDTMSASATFLTGAGIAAVAGIGIVMLQRRYPGTPASAR